MGVTMHDLENDATDFSRLALWILLFWMAIGTLACHFMFQWTLSDCFYFVVVRIIFFVFLCKLHEHSSPVTSVLLPTHGSRDRNKNKSGDFHNCRLR